MSIVEKVLTTFLSSVTPPYQHPDLTKRDVHDLLKLSYYKGLTPRPDKFVFNDGRERDLLQLKGTIPVPHKGKTYNIPISICLLDSYPFHAPHVFVNPTDKMQVKVSRHVDSAGKIYLPYLHEWCHPGSDLLGLVRICILTFSEQPPVVSNWNHPNMARKNCRKQTKNLFSSFLSTISPTHQVQHHHPDITNSDVETLMKNYKSLTAKPDNFVFNDGSERGLVQILGTVPVPYKGQPYNIPISIWLLNSHPFHAPLVFVNPTEKMQVQVSRHVDAAGKIYLPYLNEWHHPDSDLLGLVRICILTFSEQPPVFAKMNQKQMMVKEKTENLDRNLEAKLKALEVSQNKSSVPSPECPVCYEEMKPPCRIVQCRSGHLICQECGDRPEITRCPVCKQELIGRAFGIETYLRDIVG